MQENRQKDDEISHTETFSQKETRDFAREMAGRAVPDQVICLDGDLGVGKTVFAKGFAEGLGITEPVTSPTFTILREYHTGRLPLYHFDVYRIEEEDEMEETGFYDFISAGGVTLIEWAERIPDLIPEDAIHVKIEKVPVKGFDYRRITVSGGKQSRK